MHQKSFGNKTLKLVATLKYVIYLLKAELTLCLFTQKRIDTVTLPSIPLPERIDQARLKWTSLQQQHLYFAPVRHHSPACAMRFYH